MSHRSGSTRSPQALLALEDGQLFDDWGKATDGGGTWARPVQFGYQGEAMSWHNNAGAATGFASFRLAAAALPLETAGGFETAHTVHMRVHRAGNTLGPATAIHATGNGYAVVVLAGGSTVLLKVTAWAWAIVTASPTPTMAGDALSLSYRYVTASGAVELALLQNGVVTATHTDAGGFRVSTTASAPGLYGYDSVAHGDNVGDVTHEWWLTNGWQSFTEPASGTQRATGFRLVLLERQRFTDSAAPKIRRLISGELIDLSWSHKRIGGCAALDARFRYPDIDGAEAYEAKSFSDPRLADWSTSQWLGGEVVLEFHYQPVLPSGGNQDTIWRGRVSQLTSDPQTGIISLSASGLVEELDTVYVTASYRDTPIREIILDLVKHSLSKQSSSTNPLAGDTYTRFNADKILGLQSALDLRITIEFFAESLASAIGKLWEYFPPGVVWGIDREGEFYLDQQLDHYSADLSGGDIQHFHVDGDAVRFRRDMDFSRIRSAMVVLGKQEEDQPLVFGRAICERGRELFGYRLEVESEQSIGELGLAQKVAAANLKSKLLPAITGRLEVVAPLVRNRELWQSLVLGTPRVAVNDRQSSTQIGGADVPAPSIVTEYQMRRFGDVSAVAVEERGSTGGFLSLASSGREQNLDRGWLLHLALRFDHPHVDNTGTQQAFIFGRAPHGTGASRGWGALWWEAVTGRLLWIYETSGGTEVVKDTGIVVDPATPAGAVVHFTVWRDSPVGDFRFYNGNTLTATLPGSAPALRVHPEGWRWFSSGQSYGPWVAWDGACDHFWLFDAAQMVALTGGVPAFIAATTGRRLPRGRSHGLILLSFMNRDSASIPAYRDDGTQPSVPSITWAQSTVGTVGPVTTTGNAVGHVIGQEKKWGGPLVFDCEAITYEFDASSGILRRSYVLGELPVNLYTTVSALLDEVRKLDQDVRRAV